MQLELPLPQQTNLTHTDNHLNCPACDQARARKIEPATLGALTLKVAAPIWLADHRAGIADKTYRDYVGFIKVLEGFFGEHRLSSIHIGHIDTYIDKRKQTVTNSTIRHELTTLQQILNRAGLWTEIEKFYKPPRIAKSKGIAMTQEQEKLLFTAAALKPRWKVAYCCSLLTATTTAGPGELTHVHLGDIDHKLRTVHLWDGLKNVNRERMIALNDTAWWAVTELIKRAKKKGSTATHHFLLPGRPKKGPYDPEKPMGSWKKAWASLTAEAGMPTLRMYDLRHHCITKLLENPDISERTVIEMAGHVSKSMLRRYSHVRLKAKREASATLEIELKKPPQREGGVRLAIVGSQK